MNVPKLRFKEFNDEWKTTTINDQCEVFGRIGFRGYTTNDLVEKGQGAISLSPSNINGTSLNIERENTYISMFKYEESPEIKIYNNDIIFVKTGSSYGKVALVEGLNELATINPQLIVLKNIKCDNKVLCELLNDSRIQNQVEQTIVGGTIPTLSQAEFKKYKFYLPGATEQNKIGKLLRLLDKKIELQSKKIEDLKLFKLELKENLLKKFDAEKVELKEILIKWNKKNKNNKYNYVESVSNKYGFIAQNEQFEDRTVASSDTTNYYIIEKGVFAYNPSRLNVGSLALKDNDKISLVSPLYECFTTNQNKYFLYEWFNSKEFRRGTASKFEGGVRNTLNFNNLCKIKISLPSIENQNKISNLLNLFNNKINLEYEKLSKLNELKKGLMQNMFV